MQIQTRSFAALALAAAFAAACGKVRPEQHDRTGLRLSIEGATVNANRQVEVTYRVTDRSGRARGRDAVTNNWTLASLGVDPIGVQQYVAYVKNGQDLPGGQKQPGAETENASTASQGLGDGRFRYTFQTQLPEGYPTAATFRVGVYSRLQTNPGAAAGSETFDEDQPNATFDFVPAGGEPQSREVVADAACNVCHVEVRAHGGFRRGVKICTTCHTTQLQDPDTQDPARLEAANPLDLGRLVHRIHRGRQLQTVANVVAAANAATGAARADLLDPAKNPLAAYRVIGFRGTAFTFGAAVERKDVNGNVVPGSAPVQASGVNLPPPNDVRNCTLCHQGAKDAGQHLTTVERRVCTACHTDVWFESATPPDAFHVVHTTNFGPFPITNDQACAACHSQAFAPAITKENAPTLEFGRYVDYAHTVPFKSLQLEALKAEVVSMTGGPGEFPTITFRLSDEKGPITDLTPFAPAAAGAPRACTDLGGGNRQRTGTLRAAGSGPTRPDYVYWNNYFQESLHTATLTDASTGTWQYTFKGETVGGRAFTGRLPAEADGTWAVSFDVRRDRCVRNADEPASGLASPPFASPTDPTLAVTEGAVQNVFYWKPRGGEAEPRKLAVSQQKCNACHLELQFHGNQRDNVEYCVMCHTADLTDWARRPKTGAGATAVVNVAATPDGKEERSVHFRPMIHRIHMGKSLDLQKPFVIYGFGGPVFLDESGLPETAHAKCDACHEGDAYKLDAMPDRLPTIANETGTVLHAPGSGDPKVAGVASIPPKTVTCISCHDTQTAVEHAASFAPPNAPQERCLECHGDRGIRAVNRVHDVPEAGPRE